MKHLKTCVALIGLLSMASTSSQAAVAFDATDRGWYDIDGTHNNFELNYIVGALQGGAPFTADVRNFFVFDLTSLSGTVTSATLRLWNPADNPATTTNENGFISNQNPLPLNERTEIYRINDVTTPVVDLVAGNPGDNDPIGVARFNDLGDGVVYGSHVASTADNGTFVQIALNSAAISAINAHAGGLFAVGGNITTLDDLTTNTEALFRFTNGIPLGDTQLLLTTAPVPEPETYALMLAGLGLVGFAARRRKCG